MRRILLIMACGLGAIAQTTQLDPTQLKRPIKLGTTLPATCTAGDLFFKTDAAAGSNLYGCVAANTWSPLAGLPPNCSYNAGTQVLQCQDGSGNVFTPVKASTTGVANQWVDYVTAAGVAHTSQPAASQIGNAVDQTANYANPSWISSLAWSKLTGLPATFNAGQLQGRTIAGTTPTDAQYLGWSYATGQWEPKTLPVSVPSIFGRTGAITAQSGDYSATQVTNAVDQTANYANPSWISSLGWSKLTGVPATFNAGQLQGKTVGSATPVDLQYLGWNNSAGQWEPKSLPAAGVSSVFGRAGPVAAQTGDYSFAQIAGTAAAAQLPAVAMRTDQGNTVSAGTQDFRGAAHTLPMKSGLSAGMPGTCAVGETYFATDAQAGSNVYGCTAANTWTPQGATVDSDGFMVGARATLNFVTGLGLTNTLVDTGTQINLQIGLDTATVETQNGEQSGTALYCATAGGSGLHYQCSMSPTAIAYTAGMVLHWKPDVSAAGGATTIDIDQLGDVPVRLADGVSSPGASDVSAGRMYELWYDGSIFRLVTGGATGPTGSVSSIFGRSGAVVAQAGDYTASQITGLAAVATSGSYGDLSGKPAIPGIPSSTALLKGDGAGNAVAAVAGTDYLTASSAILASQLPAPGAATLGGVRSKDCTGAGHVVKIGTDGTVSCAADSGSGIVARAIGYVFSGGGAALSAGTTAYYTAPFACTIAAWNLTVDTGTATIDVWKIASGSAIPTVSNSITASATPQITTGTALHSTSLAGWTTAVAANDIFGFNLKAVASATTASLVLECDQ